LRGRIGFDIFLVVQGEENVKTVRFVFYSMLIILSIATLIIVKDIIPAADKGAWVLLVITSVYGVVAALIMFLLEFCRPALLNTKLPEKSDLQFMKIDDGRVLAKVTRGGQSVEAIIHTVPPLKSGYDDFKLP
jgi:hypothetical protein